MDFLAMDPNKLHRARQSVMTRAKEKEEVRATEEKIESRTRTRLSHSA